jgi:hypothetical protein
VGNRLGILVNTNRHPDYVRQLARAASGCRKQVHVHFSGDGLALADHPALADLERIATVTRSSGLATTGGEKAIIDLPRFFRTCDRCVVF